MHTSITATSPRTTTSLTVAEVGRQHLEASRLGRNRNTWLKDDRDFRNYVLPHAIAKLAVADVRPEDAGALYADIDVMSPNTRHRVAGLLRRVFDFAVEQGHVEVNVVRRVVTGRSPSAGGQPRARQFDDHSGTIATLEAYRTRPGARGPRPSADPEDLLHLVMETGRLISHVCGLRWTDVDLNSGTVTFAGRLLKAESASAPRRWEAFEHESREARGPEALSALARAILERRWSHRVPGAEFVFMTQRGSVFDAVALRKSVKAARTWYDIDGRLAA